MKIPAYLLAVLLLAVLLTAGCQTDYTEEALQRAREYTLNNTRMLPEIARNNIRYVTPILQTAPIFSHYPMRLTEYGHISRNIDFNPLQDPNLDTIAAQFVWTPPKLGYSVIAIGRSRKDLSYWTPLKIVLKHVVPNRWLYESARSKAISYVTNNMLYLSRLERVRVRTSEAEIRETQFDLEYLFEEQFESAQSEWKTFLEELKKQRNRKQYSVVWNADDPSKRIVITGFGSEFDLSGWKPSCGMVIPVKQLDEYTAEITEKLPAETEGPKKTADAGKSAEPVKTASSGNQAKSAKPVSSGNQAKSAKPVSSGNQAKSAKPVSSGNQAKSAKPVSSGNQAKSAKPADSGRR